MGRVADEDIQYKIEEINDILGKKYASEHPEKKRDWKIYEPEFSQWTKTAMENLGKEKPGNREEGG